MAGFLQNMYSLSLCILGCVLLGKHATAASFSGPGNISVKYGGVVNGCLDQTMKWVVDGNCGVFNAKKLTGGSTVVQFTTPDGPCCATSLGVLTCTTPNSIQNFIPVGSVGEFTALHDNSYQFVAGAVPTGSTAQNLSYNLGNTGNVHVNLFWTAT